MSRPLSPIVCDGPGCGKQKQEANHWWTAAIPKDRQVNATTWIAPPFEIRMWEGERRTHQLRAAWDLFDFCGQTCVIKFISEQMGKSRAESPVQSPGDHQESNPGTQGGQNSAE